MGGSSTEQTSPSSSHVPKVVPVIQVVGILAVVGLAVADLMIPDGEVSWIVYGLIGSIAIGVAPDNLWSIIRGK